jgi:hypothetical protein
MKREDIAPADRAAESVEHAQAIAGQVERTVGWFSADPPALPSEGGWRRPRTLAADMDDTQVLDGVEKRLARRC